MRLQTDFDKWLARPMSGTKGLHQDIFTAAAFLLEEGWSEAETLEMLRAATEDVGRAVPQRELLGAVDYAKRKAAGQVTPLSHPWPQRNDFLRAQVVRQNMPDMTKLQPRPETPRQFLDYLYRPEDLICIGRSAFQFKTLPLHEIPEGSKDLHLCEFINPSPMSAIAGLTTDERWSEHARSNTGPRIYGVIEFDDGTPPTHAAILKHLATRLPLVMIVFSGKTSLHGWFLTSGLDSEAVRRFYAEAIELGADPKMFSPCQFSRLPGGTNGSTSHPQSVLYLNPTNAAKNRP